MPTIRVEVGTVCPGGSHVEVVTYEDDVIVSREFRDATSLLPGRPIQTRDIAVDRILSESSGRDIPEFKADAERKSVVIGEVRPRESATPDPRVSGGTSGPR